MSVSEEQAVRLLVAITSEAARWITRPMANREALIAKVATYIDEDPPSGKPDWEYLVRVVTQPPQSYKKEHVKRELRAKQAV
jgi:hypothetical protein